MTATSPPALNLADNALVTAALAFQLTSDFDDVQPENRVRDFLPTAPPRLRVIDGFLPDRVGDFSDDLRQTASAKPYAYVSGNPLNATDPSGMFGWDDVTHAASRAAGAVGGAVSATMAGANPIEPDQWVQPFKDAYNSGTNWVSHQLDPSTWSYGGCLVVCYQYTPANGGTHQWGIGLAVNIGITGNGAPVPNGGVCGGIKLVDLCNPNNGPSDKHGSPGNWKGTWSCGAGAGIYYMGDEHRGAW